MRAPDCVYQEPDLIERIVRDWLTEDIDRVMIDDADDYERIRAVAGRISRRAKGVIAHYDGQLPIFEHYGVARQLDEAFRRKVTLKSGGYLVIDETEAMIAIDVNTAATRQGVAGGRDPGVNSEAVDESRGRLAPRNIGGLVVVDLIDMKSRRHQAAVYKAMKAALKRDRARTNVLAISELGLMEMTRQRQEESILSQTYVDCPYCKGHGVIKSPLSLSVDIQRQIAAVMRKNRKENNPCDLQVLIAPLVLERLRSTDEAMLVELQENYPGKLAFRSEPYRHPESFQIMETATGKVLYSVGDPKGN